MKRLLLVLSFLVGAGGVAAAQGLNDMRINEIQVYNTDGYEDDYGHRVGWIELHNTGHAVVDLGGTFLRVRGKVYPIPKGDPRTVVGPLGYVVFFAEGMASKGTFHTNFTLEETDFIEYSQSREGAAVDRLDYNLGDMRDNVSYGYFVGENGAETLGNLAETTPMASNNTLELESRSELFRRRDPNGLIMALMAMSVVFCALVLLYFIFKGLGRLNMRLAKPKAPKAAPITVDDKNNITGDEFAAIAIALFRYSEDLHDVENTVLTINRGAKAYSPWSSKIYGLRQIPDKR